MSAANRDERPRIPDLDLIRPIGSGGFGTVWLAANATTGKRCAVKVIPRRGAGGSDPAGREIVSLTRLEAHIGRGSPHLLPVRHVGRTDDFLFYTMDLADDASGGAGGDGGYRPATLDGRLREGPLDPAAGADAARALLAGLASLHRAGMVHRDVKPSNCLFAGGELHVADFGLVADCSRGLEASRVGTAAYMPPDGRMDFRADVWAAGLVIYEMLTGLPAGRFPHLGPRAAAIAADPALGALLRIALGAGERDPARRFADAGEMAAALDEALREADQAGAARPGRRRAMWIGRAAVAAFAATAVIIAALGSRGPDLVAVTFITEPDPEAEVIVDGRPLRGPDGRPAVTPCTVDGLPAGVHSVGFRAPGRPDLDAGRVDFRRARQVTARWPAGR